MFIYRYMGGMADYLAGGESDANYNPHEHRKVPKPTSYAETMIHMIKGSLGAGMLAMPDALRRVGLVVGLLGIVVIGIFATYCLLLLISAQYEQCRRSKRGYMAYHKSMRLALETGPPGLRCLARPLAVVVDVMMCVWQIGICAIYFVFAAENLKQVLDFYGMHHSVRFLIVCLFVPQVLINLIRDLKMLTPISALSNLLMFLGILLVFWYLIEDDIEIDENKFKVKSLMEIPVFIGITLFALEAVGVVLALEYNMKDPARFVGPCGLLSVGMLIIVLSFIIVGLFGNLKYGDDSKGSITLNLPEEDKKAQAAKLLLALALYLSIPLQNFVAYKIIWRKISKKQARPNKVMDFALRIMLIVIPFSMAVAAPSLSGFIALMGALCLSMLAIMFPAIIDFCVWYPDQYGPAKYKAVRDVVIFIVGTFCLISGVYTSVLEIAADFKEEVAVVAPPVPPPS